MTEQILKQPAAKVTARAKFALGMQVFLLRRGWMGPADDILMVITTKGRKTGKEYSIPIGYMRDGEDILTLSGENPSNWFRNVLANNGEATLNIKKETIDVRGELVTDEAERQQIFNIYKQNEKYFKSNFRIELDSSEDELQTALAQRMFIRFRKI